MEKDNIEENRLKIEEIDKLKDSSYSSKINTIFWTALSALELLIRYVTLDKSFINLMPIASIPLIGYIVNKIRVDSKINNLEKEMVSSKQR